MKQTADGFVVPMPWGEGTDWYRNVRAAGECVMRWKDRDYVLVDPEVIDAAAAQSSFNAIELSAMTRFHIQKVLHLRKRS